MPRKLSTRTFYRRVVYVTVLSEDPIQEGDLANLHYHITEGHCSGQITYGPEKQVNGKNMAKALERQGSDPGFFNLTKHGEDTDE